MSVAARSTISLLHVDLHDVISMMCYMVAT